MIAMFDQLQASLSDLAPVLESYFKRLMELGFERSEAFQLVRDMQSSVVTEGHNK